MTTIFDKILSKEIPAKVIYEDEHILAFHDVNPQAPIHALVIPKQKIQSFAELKNHPKISESLFAGASKVASQLGLDSDGYRVIVNCGRDGQQSVEYIHVHILGGRSLKWPPG